MNVLVDERFSLGSSVKMLSFYRTPTSGQYISIICVKLWARFIVFHNVQLRQSFLSAGFFFFFKSGAPLPASALLCHIFIICFPLLQAFKVPFCVVHYHSHLEPMTPTYDPMWPWLLQYVFHSLTKWLLFLCEKEMLFYSMSWLYVFSCFCFLTLLYATVYACHVSLCLVLCVQVKVVKVRKITGCKDDTVIIFG